MGAPSDTRLTSSTGLMVIRMPSTVATRRTKNDMESAPAAGPRHPRALVRFWCVFRDASGAHLRYGRRRAGCVVHILVRVAEHGPARAHSAGLDDDSGFDNDPYSLWPGLGAGRSGEALTLALLEDLAAVFQAHGFPPLRGYALV